MLGAVGACAIFLHSTANAALVSYSIGGSVFGTSGVMKDVFVYRFIWEDR